MADSRTRRVETFDRKAPGESFLDCHSAAIVVVSGDAAGAEYPLDRDSVSIGRGPGVDVVVDDSAVSRQHAVLELGQEGFRIRDLGSTNGVIVNGTPVQAADLQHGDRFELGGHTFQYVLEERTRAPRIHTLPEPA